MISTTIGLGRALPALRALGNVQVRVGAVAARHYHNVSASLPESKKRFSDKEMKRFYKHIDGELKSGRNTVEILEKISVTENFIDQGNLSSALMTFSKICSDVEGDLHPEVNNRLHQLFGKFSVATSFTHGAKDSDMFSVSGNMGLHKGARS